MKSADTFELKYDFSCELYRLSTYSAFPAGVPVSERSLARAGFYYTGVNDKVKCFCCGLMLDNWKQGDSPVEKHRQLYPSCSFVQTLNPASRPEASPQTSLPSAVPSLSTSLENTGYFSGSYSSFPSDPEDAVMMNTPVVKAALEMGFSRSLVRQTVQRQILATGENYRTVSDLVIGLLDAEDEMREEQKEQAAEDTESGTFSREMECHSCLSLEEQLRRLQEERTCKVCMDREVSIVFIPCGHLVVCQECAPSLRKCPICRGTIKGTVRTFLS
ncbi:Baculoviral IAP repeat-containing protein 3 [Lemmus lemmus]